MKAAAALVRSVVIWVGLVGIGIVGCCPAHAASLVPARSAASVSFSRTALGQILLPVQIMGTPEQSAHSSFILDTGMETSLVSRSLVQQLALSTQTALGDNGQPIFSHGKPLRVVVLPRLTVGNLYVRHVQCLVTDDQTLVAMTGQRVSGFLGENVLARVATLLDFQTRQVTFFPHGSLTLSDLASAGMDGAAAIPLSPTPGDGWFTCLAQMQTSAGSIRQDLVVDTGCVQSIISQNAARQLGLSNSDGQRRLLLTATGRLSVSDGFLTALTLGDQSTHAITIHHTAVAYPDGPLPGDMAETLGLNVLTQYRVLLDLPGQTLYLTPITH